MGSGSHLSELGEGQTEVVVILHAEIINYSMESISLGFSDTYIHERCVGNLISRHSPTLFQAEEMILANKHLSKVKSKGKNTSRSIP